MDNKKNNEQCACTNQDNETCTCDLKEKKKKDKKNEKLEEAKEKIKELEDKLLREKAENINYLRRKEQEMERMLKYCHEDLIKEILPVIDNLERAINMKSDSEEVEKFVDGIKMVYCNLLNTLEKYEVKLIDGFNKPFDSTYHQAVLTEAKEGVESGIVIEVLQKGFLYKEKVIRPAMVKVSE